MALSTAAYNALSKEALSILATTTALFQEAPFTPPQYCSKMRRQSLQCLLRHSNVQRSLHSSLLLLVMQQLSSLLLQQRPSLLIQQHPSLQEAHILATSAIKSTFSDPKVVQVWLKEANMTATLICQQYMSQTSILTTRSSMVLMIQLAIAVVMHPTASTASILATQTVQDAHYTLLPIHRHV